jgi:hypothetical protein
MYHLHRASTRLKVRLKNPNLTYFHEKQVVRSRCVSHTVLILLRWSIREEHIVAEERLRARQFPLMELWDFHTDQHGLGVGRPDTRNCQMHIFFEWYFSPRVCRSIRGMDWTEKLNNTCLSKRGLIEGCFSLSVCLLYGAQM